MEWNTLGDTSLVMSPISQEVVADLHQLCCTEFSLAAIQEKWQKLNWKYVPAPDDQYGFKVTINDNLALTVAPEGERIGCAYLTFCYWEDYERKWHESAASFKAEKNLYDSVYDEAVTTTRLTMGAPWLAGQDKGNGSSRYTVWRGDTGLLILQQCNFDLQFGLECISK